MIKSQATKARIKRGREIKRNEKECCCVNKAKLRYKQIAKIRKWRRDVKLNYHAFVINAKWLSLRKIYIFPKSFFKGGDC